MSEVTALTVVPDPIETLTLKRTEGDPQVWVLVWKEGQMTGLWWECIDGMDRMIRANTIGLDALLMAGARAAPWLLGEYMFAADSAEMADADAIYDSYARSCKAIYAKDSKYRAFVNKKVSDA